MSKKSLAILLLLPFILSVLFFVASSFLFTKIEGDITNIVWNYKNQEAFSYTKKRIKLEATPVLANNQEDVDATLIWTVRNLNADEEEHAEIQVENGESYLVFLSTGDVVVTCKNTSGNISKSFNAKIFIGAVVTINTASPRSYQSIERKDYYGMYDFKGDKTEKATFDLDIEIKSDDDAFSAIDMYQIQTSSNIDYDNIKNRVTINGEGESFVKYVLPYDETNYAEYRFNVVNEGYNVYSYQDLLKCTNEDEHGKIVCLQTNMESIKNTYELDDSGNIKLENGSPILKSKDTVLFGNYEIKNKKFNFENEVYKFKTTYNSEYIDQYNQKKDPSAKEILKDLLAGIHIQKDFYGNGFMINAHNLTYPSSEINVGDTLVTLKDSDLFRGPLPFVIIGSYESPVVKAYGQDNVGFYVDGDNLLLNDVCFKNCDFSNILQNNDTTGTVVEVNGDNVTIQNSYLSSGRTVLRSFSNNNLLVKNSLLEKGREFIAKIGSNDYEKMNMDERIEFDYGGSHYSYTRQEFFSANCSNGAGEIADKLLFCGTGISGNDVTFDQIEPLAKVLQEALNPQSVIEDEKGDLIFKGDVTFEDSYFYQSGIFSIGIDSLFNGPYLYDGSPVKPYFDRLGMTDMVIFPDNIGGVSYPTKTILKGDTRFYDYKTIDETDANCLVYQDVSNIFQLEEAIDLDTFFPIKKMFLSTANQLGYTHIENDKEYLSAAIAKYGGGNNYSIVDVEQLDNKEELMDDVVLDTFKDLMNTGISDTSDMIKLLSFAIGRAVPMAMGFAPFNVMMYNGHGSENAYLFGEKVSLDNLRNRA